MYYKDIESNKEELERYTQAQRKASAERLKQVAAKVKAKKQSKK